MKNPFELVTASKLSAHEAIDLWCDDKRLDRVNGKENCFVNGHRGTGKSMLFRILQHDCQKLLHPDNSPSFLSVYFSVRDTEFMTEELDLFQSDSQRNIISESHFSLLILKQFYLLLLEDPKIVPEPHRQKLVSLTQECLNNCFQYSTVNCDTVFDLDFSMYTSQAIALLEQERTRIMNYVGLRLYDGKPFEGPLFLFDSLLAPIADFFSSNIGLCLYLLIDDADDLPVSHTIVLNSWIARRRESVVFKISTMFGYKTYETRSRSSIQHPHDFFHYDIATRHISNSTEDYVLLLREICEKRLKGAGIETSPGKIDPYEFFPEDPQQSDSLKQLAERLTQTYSEKYKGRSIRDYVYRHLTSEYMKDLRKSRSPHSYVYSGFETLAILSSGHVRDFIICAQRMFDNATRSDETVTKISPSIQNTIARLHADDVLDDIKNPKQKRFRASTSEDWNRIYNLITGISNLFKNKMLSDDSERRVFSFGFQNEPTEDIERLLSLAIAEGYFSKGFISRKEGTGRRTLYVLTRRLAPAFNLDVSAYSGYLSLTTERVIYLCENGDRAFQSAANCDQLTFFEIDDGSRVEPSQSEQWIFINPEEAGL